MGKIEDMRRLREQQFAETEQRRASSAKARPAAPVTPSAPRAAESTPEIEAPPAEPGTAVASPAPRREPVRSGKASASASAAQGKCPECGKMKPLQGDVLASHQKGFGKACAGSRKKPV